jgi:hypothetical protein
VTALLLVVGVLTAAAGSFQSSVDERELAEYRLSPRVFEQFRRSSRTIAHVMSRDPVFGIAPLFSQEIAQGGDVTEVAATLEARLRAHPELSQALAGASISAREYTKFALSLVAARLAFGFLESGVLKAVPRGVTADNVAFVRERRAAVDEVLTNLGIEIK